MSTRPRLSSSLGIYHVVYRGINKQRIFEDDEDYEKFLSILRKYQPICGYKLIAYCLMSNHIHLLIKPFKSRPVNNRSQLLIVTRYIHQNPVKAAVCNHPRKYKYSSFRGYFDNDLIDSELVLSEVSKKDFIDFNCEKNSDLCLDIEEEIPRLSDEIATSIMQRLSGCRNVTEFQSLDIDRRDNVLCSMRKAHISMKQASRITGISYGVIKKALALAV